MFDRPNPLRAKLAAGNPVVGSVVFSWSPNVMDVAGHAGLDFMRIDGEHAWRRDDMVEHLIRAAWLGGVVPLMRIDREDPYLIRKALEIGAGAVLVPDVRDAATAAAVVAAGRFPPRGRRGFSANCFAGGWGNHPTGDWIAWSDREPMLGVMIEHPDGMAALDEILSVDGLDFIYFGGGDFSVAIGLGKTDRNHPEVRAAFETVVRKTRAAGRHAFGNPGTDPAEIARMRALGVDMLEIGNDIGILASAWKRAAAAVAAE